MGRINNRGWKEELIKLHMAMGGKAGKLGVKIVSYMYMMYNAIVKCSDIFS